MSKEIRSRASLVCSRCHERKVRCDLISQTGGNCSNCQREGRHCSIHAGSRKRKAAAIAPIAGPENASVPTVNMAPSLLSDVSPAPSESRTTHTTPITVADRRGYFGDQSVMSFSLDARASDDGTGGILTTSDVNAILALTRAAALPSEALSRALADAYFKEMFARVPVIDVSELEDAQSSPLLRLSVYFAGSMMRRPKDYPSGASPKHFFAKIKTLLALDVEKNVFVVLKTLCLLGSWSWRSPQQATLDCPWQWAGMAGRLAIQLGLHRDSTYAATSRDGTNRRIWWYLVNNDVLQSACYGRPSMLRFKEFDVRLPESYDFVNPGVDASFFCTFTRLCSIISSISALANPRHDVATEDISKQLDSILQWIKEVPEELVLFDATGNRKPYNRMANELHGFYLVALILVYLLPGSHRQSPNLRTSVIVAASCQSALLQEILYRDEISYLLPIYGWVILVATIPRLFASAMFPDLSAVFAEELDIGRRILRQMSDNYPSAALVLAKIDRLQQDRQASRLMQSSITGCGVVQDTDRQGDSLWSDVRLLFPFPETFSPCISLLRNLGLSGPTIVVGETAEAAAEAAAEPRRATGTVGDIPWQADWSDFSLDDMETFVSFFPPEGAWPV
ncbi:hypothetical protein QBC46DRAFT_397306 [Diplogelasinospora grovesii]|uniref:Zn(2)-C6 fungal-type domain-containing protein n=1 Tax=Diplogelasinospora grovesii TaxID=303347 RepID=A0AAN6RZF1_9PEZI|nr:hypothetical protein QBC46DRAFT_397306 [Diplogelasinospora grovesii]